MKQFLPLILLCGLVGCQKGSKSESQTSNADSVVRTPPTSIDTSQTDPSITALINKLAPPVDNVGDHSSSAKYRMRGHLLIVSIRDDEEMAYSFRLGIFYKNNDQWQSSFKSETVPGSIDTLIDMNGDDRYELIVNDEQGQSAGSTTNKIFYAGINGGPFEIVETLGTSFAGFDAYTDKTNTTTSFERDGDKVNIRVTNELIPGMDPTVDPAVQGDEPTTTFERIWSWNGGKLTKLLPADFLVINGKDIRVRDTPTTGKVVMKLNSRDKCKILEKGREEVIRGKTDNWYKIDFKGKTGWVFGSQTSVGRI